MSHDVSPLLPDLLPSLGESLHGGTYGGLVIRTDEPLIHVHKEAPLFLNERRADTIQRVGMSGAQVLRGVQMTSGNVPESLPVVGGCLASLSFGGHGDGDGGDDDCLVAPSGDGMSCLVVERTQVELDSRIQQVLVQRQYDSFGNSVPGHALIIVRTTGMLHILRCVRTKATTTIAIRVVDSQRVQLAHVALSRWVFSEFVGITVDGDVIIWRLSNGDTRFKARHALTVHRHLYHKDDTGDNDMDDDDEDDDDDDDDDNDAAADAQRTIPFVDFSDSPRHLVVVWRGRLYRVDCTTIDQFTAARIANLPSSSLSTLTLIPTPWPPPRVPSSSPILCVAVHHHEFPFMMAIVCTDLVHIVDRRAPDHALLQWPAPQPNNNNDKGNGGNGSNARNRARNKTSYSSRATRATFGRWRDNGHALMVFMGQGGVMVYRFRRVDNAFVCTDAPLLATAFPHRVYSPCHQHMSQRVASPGMHVIGMVVNGGGVITQMNAMGEIRTLDNGRRHRGLHACSGHDEPAWWTTSTEPTKNFDLFPVNAVLAATRSSAVAAMEQEEDEEEEKVVEVSVPRTLWDVAKGDVDLAHRILAQQNVRWFRHRTSTSCNQTLCRRHDDDDGGGVRVCRFPLWCSEWMDVRVYCGSSVCTLEWPNDMAAAAATQASQAATVDLSQNIELLMLASQGEDMTPHVQVSQVVEPPLKTLVRTLSEQWQQI